MTELNFFSATYAEARERFVAAATRCDLDIESHPHPLIGPQGVALALERWQVHKRSSLTLLRAVGHTPRTLTLNRSRTHSSGPKARCSRSMWCVTACVAHHGC